MRKLLFLISLFFILVGCNQNVSEDDLIGGNWLGVPNYEDGKKEGAPDCYPFHDGIDFKTEEKVYNATYERNFKYHLRDKDIITFLDKNRSYSYQLKIISEDELALEGLNLQEGRSCVLKRQ